MRSSSENITSIQDIDNFESIFKEYFTILTYYAIKFVKDDDMAKEIVQNVFLNLWEKREELHSSIPLKSYLFRSVYNRSMNYLRDKAKFHSDDISNIDYLNRLEKEGSDNYELHELEARITAEVNQLPHSCGRIFRMSRYEGKKYNEIALELGVSLKTVEAQMTKALKILRNRLSEYLNLIILLIIYIFLKH